VSPVNLGTLSSHFPQGIICRTPITLFLAIYKFFLKVDIILNLFEANYAWRHLSDLRVSPQYGIWTLAGNMVFPVTDFRPELRWSP
jgi:hypothetical protein